MSNKESGKVITHNGVSIGYTAYAPYRKSNYLCVQRGNKVICLAPFSSKEKAEYFFKALCEMCGVDYKEDIIIND